MASEQQHLDYEAKLDTAARFVVARLCPSWDGDEARAVLHQVASASREAKPGISDQAVCLTPFGGALILHFDCAGGTFLDPDSTYCEPLVELARLCKFVFGDRFRIGRLEGACR